MSASPPRPHRRLALGLVRRCGAQRPSGRLASGSHRRQKELRQGDVKHSAQRLDRHLRREIALRYIRAGRQQSAAPVRVSTQSPRKFRERPPAITQALTSTVLQERARTALLRKLAADPRDQDALLGLGELSRRAGEFAQAAAAYRALHELRRDPASAWSLGAIGAGQPLSAPPEGFHAAPFVRLTNFLRPEEQRKLRVALSAGRDEVELATTMDRTPDFRKALLVKGRRRRETRSWFVPKLRAVLPDVAARLGVFLPQRRQVDLSLTATLPGGFYRVHRDVSDDPDNPNFGRVVSYVYYCHSEPKSFAGGELLLYDTCLATRRFRQGAFSRIDPAHNTLVLFPSGYYHEILPVYGESDRLRDARFTVNGWVRGDHFEPAVGEART